MAGKFAKNQSRIILALLPLSLVLLAWLSYPYKEILAAKVVSLSNLTFAQKGNIKLAAAALDDSILLPGQSLSFNARVGDRSEARGYRSAPSYLGTGSPVTTGGGICLVSSALYQAALESSLAVTERTPHTRTITSVPAGLDATVWYGGCDLRLTNPYKFPVKINTQYDPQALKVLVKGCPDEEFKSCVLRTSVIQKADGHLLVDSFKVRDGKASFVSRDSYRVN